MKYTSIKELSGRIKGWLPTRFHYEHNFKGAKSYNLSFIDVCLSVTFEVKEVNQFEYSFIIWKQDFSAKTYRYSTKIGSVIYK